VIRTVLFLFGLLLMALALVAGMTPIGQSPEARKSLARWVFALGVLLTVGAHGWPEVL
jgi:hypothetical protein